MVRLATRWESLFLIGLAAAVSAPAAAQYGPPPTPQPMPQPPSSSQATPAAPAAPATRADVLRAAACVAGRDAAAADALLATSPFSADERERAVRLLRVAQRCLRADSPVATSAFVLRGAVAEVLYETRFADPVAARAPAAAAAPFLRAADLAGRDNAAVLTTHFELAQCAAPAQPALVRALLATEPGSDAERAAMTALYPALGACVPTGTQLTIDQGGMRSTLAEALYRWSVVQRDGPTSAWAAPAAPAAPAQAANPGG